MGVKLYRIFVPSMKISKSTANLAQFVIVVIKLPLDQLLRNSYESLLYFVSLVLAPLSLLLVLGTYLMWYWRLRLVASPMMGGLFLGGSTTNLTWQGKSQSMRSPFVKRSPLERSMATTNNSNGNDLDIRLLLFHHKILLQSLYHHHQYLDLLHQYSEQILLSCRQ